MSRLIDADALAKDFEKNCVEECACCTNGITHTVHVGTYAARIHESCGLIATAPTINAIPMEWLVEHKTKYIEDWGVVPVGVGEALIMWQKEQEAR